ncbi:hypothetical protein FQZ97_1041720 [compost metagenome]
MAACRQHDGQRLGQVQPRAAVRLRHQRVAEAGVFAGLPGRGGALPLFGAADDVWRAGFCEQAFGGVAKNVVHEVVLIEGQGRGR